MITPDDNVYLIDFGIARLFKPGKTKDTVSYVSAGYAAPEQYGRAQTSPQSDIYSLGATLHQLLSGNDPSSNYPLFTFKPLQSYNPDVPTALADFVAKMVSTDPAQRPANMAMVRKESGQIQMQVKQGYMSLYTPPPPNPMPILPNQ
jgi:serine/threonine protein kinase